MLIEVFGPGCPKCHESAETARGFLADKGLEGDVRVWTELDVMIVRGVVRTPTIFIDERKIVEGRVLRVKDLEHWVAGQDG